MPRMLRMERLDPYETFGASLRAARHALRVAYEEAWKASDRCNELQNTVLHEQLSDPDPFEMAGFPSLREPRADVEDLDRMWVQAYAEDLHADHQAGVVLLFADDALQRLAKGALNLRAAPGIKTAFGRHYSGVRLTALLKAGTNAIRHASEWDEELQIPYPQAEQRTSRQRQQMESIEVLQRVLGVGISEPIREAHSWKILSLLDGKYGTEDPDFARVESAVVGAAKEIAASAGSDGEARLNAALYG